MTVIEAQQDLRRAYAGGGPGVFVSGLVWLAAALAYDSRGVETGFVVLFAGGMLIFPVSTLLCRFVFRRAPVGSGNPLGLAALESTIAMLGGLFAAWLFLSFAPARVFPLAAIAVGTHYFVFRTVYGDPLYWVLGGLIAGTGLLDLYIRLGPSAVAIVSAIEIASAVVLTVRNGSRQVQSGPDVR